MDDSGNDREGTPLRTRLLLAAGVMTVALVAVQRHRPDAFGPSTPIWIQLVLGCLLLVHVVVDIRDGSTVVTFQPITRSDHPVRFWSAITLQAVASVILASDAAVRLATGHSLFP